MAFESELETYLKEVESLSMNEDPEAWLFDEGPQTISKLVSIIREQQSLIEKLKMQICFAAGYISTTPGFTDKHPQEALEYIQRESPKGTDV